MRIKCETGNSLIHFNTMTFHLMSHMCRLGYSQGSDWPGRVTWCSFTPSNSSSAPPLDRKTVRIRWTKSVFLWHWCISKSYFFSFVCFWWLILLISCKSILWLDTSCFLSCFFLQSRTLRPTWGDVVNNEQLICFI